MDRSTTACSRGVPGFRTQNSHTWRSALSALTAILAGPLACTEPEPPAVRLAFVVEPATTTRTVPFTAEIQVEARNAGGGRVMSWNGMVFLTIDNASVVLDGARAVQAVAGLATFPNLAVNVASTGIRLTASAMGVESAESRTFDVHPGPPARLSYAQSPSRGRTGAPLEPFVVEIADAGGFRNTTDNRTITLTLAQAPAGATLAGTMVATSTGGVATFGDLTADKAGDYILVASAPGLSDAAGAFFTVRPLFVSVTAGYFHSCGRAGDGSVFCWGDVGAEATRVVSAPAFASISSGRDTRCATTSAGAAYCWDGNGPPALVSTSVELASVMAGYAHNCGLTAAGVAYCWGDNSLGQIGNASFGGSASSPTAVHGGHAFAQVSPGRYFTCGITTSGAAYCWGGNASGQLGTGTEESTTVPTAVGGGHTFSAIGAGGWFSCGLTTAGDAYCWGSNGIGELGTGTTQNATSPVAVIGGLKFTALSVGNRHACALTAVGTAYCWGDNSAGMVGVVSVEARVDRPTAVSGDRKFTSIRAGRFHTCGVATDGETYCWGSNAGHQLGSPGNSTSTPRLVP